MGTHWSFNSWQVPAGVTLERDSAWGKGLRHMVLSGSSRRCPLTYTGIRADIPGSCNCGHTCKHTHSCRRDTRTERPELCNCGLSPVWASRTLDGKAQSPSLPGFLSHDLGSQLMILVPLLT